MFALPAFPALLLVVPLLPLVALVIRRLRQRSLWRIPGPASASYISGNLSLWFGHDALPSREKMMRDYGRIFRLTGFLGDSQLSIADTRALHDILVKHQDIFDEAEYFSETMHAIFGPTLLSTSGAVHRKQRKLMNPAFSTTHMRRMVPVFQSLTTQLQRVMRAEIGKETKEIDMMDYVGRLALELISQAGFGETFNSIEGGDHTYSVSVKKIIPTVAKIAMWRPLLPPLRRALPRRLLRLLAEKIPWPTLHELMGLSDYLHTTSQSIWENKKRLYAMGDKSVVNEHGEGKDVMSILLKANLEASDDEKLADDELLAQINLLMVAGSDTTSNAIIYLLHHLSLDPDRQERLRAELVKAGGEKGRLGYDELTALPFLDAVVRETLRLHPPVNMVQRESRADLVLPLAHSYRDVHGKECSELFVPKGTIIYVNIVGVNRDPAVWGPDAHVWRPERWLSPLPSSVTDARVPGVYSNTLTFVGGGRSCIGFKFSELEMKTVLSQLIASFRFVPSETHEVIWRFGGVVTPSVKGSKTNKPEMPLRVSVAN